MNVVKFPAKAEWRSIWTDRVASVAAVLRQLHTTRARDNYLAAQGHAVARRLHRLGVPHEAVRAELAAFERAVTDAAKDGRQ